MVWKIVRLRLAIASFMLLHKSGVSKTMSPSVMPYTARPLALNVSTVASMSGMVSLT